MQTVIAILRGVNVSGQKKVAMPALKLLFEGLGFKNVLTYIQSGNVIFTTDEQVDTMLSKKIGEKIQTVFGFNVPVVIRTMMEMEHIVTNNPFLKLKNVDLEKLHVTFLEEFPKFDLVDKLNAFDYHPDQFIISGNEIYLYCSNGYGRTKLSNKFFENKLEVTATTRNWKTVNAFLDMAPK